MPGFFNAMFNPAQVALGNQTGGNMWGGSPPKASGPYMPTKPPVASPPGRLPIGNPQQPKPGPTGNPPGRLPIGNTPAASPSAPQSPSNILGPEVVRATGTGPYDNAYRQDLATYAGGQFQRPGGVLGLNPTGPIQGQATGGGNAPVQGLPNDLLGMALGGQGFSAPQPPATSTPKAQSGLQGNWQQWLKQFQNQGSLMRGV